MGKCKRHLRIPYLLIIALFGANSCSLSGSIPLNRPRHVISQCPILRHLSHRRGDTFASPSLFSYQLPLPIQMALNLPASNSRSSCKPPLPPHHRYSIAVFDCLCSSCMYGTRSIQSPHTYNLDSAAHQG